MTNLDLLKSDLIALADLPKYLPPTRSGKSIHIGSIYRWVTRGVQGRKLEVIRVGGRIYTSESAVRRFLVVCEEQAPDRSASSEEDRRRKPPRQDAADLETQADELDL